ncbi:glycosyltransferase [Metabacillus sp. cB07]|uniref:glycosyltransferase n=1 Tax=Metabacillus sp. cB07 TaxID=2806989 RepID=UPI001939AE10|nr:glycosyltransferase [Metabacillus sp. cB07]
MGYKVSIILPIYNVEKFLKKCLETLVNQTLKDIEIIAVNDCSTDNSLKILHEYQSQYGDKFQIINSKDNVKQGGARNLGIKAARGEYVGFVDPDDYVTLDMFEKMYHSAIENNAEIVTCDYYEIIGETKIYKSNDLPEGILDKENKRIALQRKYGWELWQQIYKKELFTVNSIQFSENLYVTDLEIGALIVMYANRITKVKEALYFYVKHDSATTTFKVNDRKIYDLLVVSDKRINHFKERKLYDEYKQEIDYIYFWHVCIVSVSRCVLNFSKPQYKKIDEIKGKILINIPDIRNNRYYIDSNLYTKLILVLLFKNKYILASILKGSKILSPNLKNKVKNIIKNKSKI